MEIIRIGAAGIACVLAAIFMKTAKPEYSVYLTMAAGLFILAFAVGKFSYLYESLKKIQQYVPVDTTYMNILMKMIGITYIGQFSAETAIVRRPFPMFSQLISPRLFNTGAIIAMADAIRTI